MEATVVGVTEAGAMGAAMEAGAMGAATAAEMGAVVTVVAMEKGAMGAAVTVVATEVAETEAEATEAEVTEAAMAELRRNGRVTDIVHGGWDEVLVVYLLDEHACVVDHRCRNVRVRGYDSSSRVLGLGSAIAVCDRVIDHVMVHA